MLKQTVMTHLCHIDHYKMHVKGLAKTKSLLWKRDISRNERRRITYKDHYKKAFCIKLVFGQSGLTPLTITIS